MKISAILIIGILLLMAGLIIHLIPSSYFSINVRVRISQGSDLELFDQSSKQMVYAFFSEIDNEAIIIYQPWDGPAQKISIGTSTVKANTTFQTEHLMLRIIAPSGVRTFRNVVVEENVLFKIILEKDSIIKDVSKTVDWNETGLRGFERSQGVVPPYNISCIGLINYSLTTSLEHINGSYEVIPFFTISVNDLKTVSIIYNSSRPVENIIVLNPLLEELRAPGFINLSFSLQLIVLGLVISGLGLHKFRKLSKFSGHK